MSDSVSTNQNLTFEDVLHAVGDGDPNQTNFGKIRVLLGGRGSGTTIQKHLNKIRSDRAAMLLPVEDTKIPAMPDSVASIWGAAYGSAMAMVRARMDAVVQERDALTVLLIAAGQDREGWEAEVTATVAQVISLESQLSTANEAAEAVRLSELDKAAAAKTAADVELAKMSRLLDSTCNELTQEKVSAAHAAEMADSGRVMMRQELARLTDQVGELKAALYKRAEAAPVPT